MNRGSASAAINTGIRRVGPIGPIGVIGLRKVPRVLRVGRPEREGIVRTWAASAMMRVSSGVRSDHCLIHGIGFLKLLTSLFVRLFSKLKRLKVHHWGGRVFGLLEVF